MIHIKHSKVTTLKDIAREANVSLSTVSRALRNDGYINSQTKLHIQSIAKNMGYSPNMAARSLRMQKTNMLMVLIPDISNLFHTDLIQGIEQVARDNGYQISIINTNESPEQEIKAIQTANEFSADGIIALPIHLPNYENVTTKLFILARHDARDFSYNFIANDDIEGAFIATNHLVERGCKKVLFINGPAEQAPSVNRLKGYKKALQLNHLPFEERYVLNSGLSTQDGYDAFLEISLRCSPPYGIFCFNDTIAIGVLHAIRNAGLSTPEDVSVVGYDDISIASFLERPLTTIRQASFNMGSWGAEMLINMISSPENYTNTISRVIHPELIVRKTT